MSPVSVSIAGALSLAVAMGIGRFAFTPMLPLMLRAGDVDVAQGGWLAAANYVGYLVGACLLRACACRRCGWRSPHCC